MGKRTRTAAAVGGAVLFLAGVAAGVAVWRSAQPGKAAYRVSLQAVPAADSADWSANDSVCPASGRGPGPLGADNAPARSTATASRTQQVGAGQLLAYHVRIEADATAPPLGEVTTELTFRSTSPASPVELATGVLCAFVDDSDPLTTGTNATATLTANDIDDDGRRVTSSVAVGGLEPGGSAVVELWVQAAAVQPRSTAVVEAAIDNVVAPAGQRARVVAANARLITSAEQSRDVQIELVGPESADLQPGDDVRLTMRLGNRSAGLAHEVVARMLPDATLTIKTIEVSDDAGAATSCEQSAGQVICSAPYLVPSERVTVDIDATIGADTPQVFSGTGAACRPNGQDLCARANVVSIGGSPSRAAGAEVALDLPAPNRIGATKVTVGNDQGLYVGRYADFQYIVALGADEPVQDVTVDDPSCAPVRLVSGDDGADGVLSAGERWVYVCSALVDRSQLADVTITATTAAGAPVEALTRLTTRVLDPEIAVSTTGSSDRPELEVVNSGDAELTGVVVDGRGCGTEIVRGDVDEDGVLDAGERWVFGCRATSGAVRAYGTDPAGGAVTAAIST